MGLCYLENRSKRKSGRERWRVGSDSSLPKEKEKTIEWHIEYVLLKWFGYIDESDMKITSFVNQMLLCLFTLTEIKARWLTMSGPLFMCILL